MFGFSPMFLVIDPVKRYRVFLREEPTADEQFPADAPLIRGAVLENNPDHVDSDFLPEGVTEPVPTVGRSRTARHSYRAFRCPSELAASGYDRECEAHRVWVYNTWAEYRQGAGRL